MLISRRKGVFAAMGGLLAFTFAAPASAQSVTLALSSATALPASSVTINLSMQNSGTTAPSAIQWTLGYSGTDVSSISITAGPSLSSASKSLTCNLVAYQYTCVAWGMNTTSIGSGVLASVTVQLAATAKTNSLALANVVAASAAGSAIAATGTGATLTISSASVSQLSCAALSLISATSTTCTVTITGAVASLATTVALTAGNSALTVPASVTVPAGAATAQFTVTAATVTTAQTSAVTAAIGASRVSVTFTVNPAPPLVPALTILGAPSELTGTTVKPALAPKGFTGNLVVRGTGAMVWTPFANGNGVSFRVGGQQNGNTAFFAFAGSAIPGIFNLNQGELDFSMKSSYSFAQRMALPQHNDRYTIDVADGTAHLFYFDVTTMGSRLIFYYQTGGTVNQYYYVPVGQEDIMYGKGVIANVRLTWNGTKSSLYLNGVLVSTSPYTKATTTWAAPTMSLGATTLNYSGGYYALDDAVANLQVLVPQTAPVNSRSRNKQSSQSLACTPRVIHPGDQFTCRALSTSDSDRDANASVSSNDPSVDLPSALTIRPGSAGVFRGRIADHAAARDITISLQHGDQLLTGDLTILPADRPLAPARPIAVQPSSAPHITDLVNGASRASTPSCLPGSLVSLTGASLHNPAEPADLHLLLNGDLTPVLSASETQVDFLCPDAPRGTAFIASIENSVGASNSVRFEIADGELGILSLDGSGKGQGAITIAGTQSLAMIPDSGLQAFPARPLDSITIPITGADPQLPVTVTIADTRIPATLAPSTFDGFYQAVVTLPSDLEGDAIPVQVEQSTAAGLRRSNTVTIAIESPR